MIRAMKTSFELPRGIEADLGIQTPYVRGEKIPVTNCWHFCTDGRREEDLFHDETDFVDGMNRIYLVSLKFSNIIILAFSLMDTHIHFILHGPYESCNAFIHEYIRRTSSHIATRRKTRKRLKDTSISYRQITNDFYLKTAICYVLKNPTIAGLAFAPYDYPWSSGALYFRRTEYWTAPIWTKDMTFTHELLGMSFRDSKARFRTKLLKNSEVKSCNGLIFPGEYVAFQIVERIFRTTRSFNFFMGICKEEDLNALSATASRLSIPIHELRQLRDEACMEFFKNRSIRCLDTAQRLRLARTLRKRYNCSVKQLVRVCGLIYEEVKDKI